MMCLNISEARITRDHNIDRKKSLLERGVRGAFSSLPRAREHTRVAGDRSGSNGAAPAFFGIVTILDGKRIPLFLNML